MSSQTTKDRCPHCGYTKMDASWFGDHWRCKGRKDAPWEIEAAYQNIQREAVKRNPFYVE